MKVRHNKKRNTAFVYEALVREATVAVLKNEKEKKDKAVSILRRHFHGDGILKKDLECYRSLYENQNIGETTSEKILKEVRLQRQLIDSDNLFKQQSVLIHDINKELSPDVFNNFVPNYKTLATIDQIFSLKTSPKNRIILESEIVKSMGAHSNKNRIGAKVDKLLFKTFVEKFNNKYETELLEEQKELLTHYIVSFSDNALQLKYFLNEEVTRLKEQLLGSLKTKEISLDSEMLEKTNKIVDRLKSYSAKEISEDVILTVLKTQALVKEINADGNND
jgi:hypothetical protein